MSFTACYIARRPLLNTSWTLQKLRLRIRAASRARTSACSLTQEGEHGVLQGPEGISQLEYIRNSKLLHTLAEIALDLPKEAQTIKSWKERLGLLDGCEAHRAPLNVALLLSGGVDSSLALRLLQAAGHNVTAFYLQIWFQEDFRNFWDACPWEDDLATCQKVCEQAGVSLRVVPLTQQYWERVVTYSISEIRAGRTPNPDILCNSRVKFGAFLEYLEGLGEERYDRIASGHYARLVRSDSEADSPVSLALSPDPIKDQTYFLSHLSQDQLARLILPLGYLDKGTVRRLAAEAGLPNQMRKDSQGICFLGKVNFSEFVERHLGSWPGPLIDQDSGQVVGYHQGCWFFTLGQRKGIHLSGGPWYVTKKDMDTNAVYILRSYYDSEKQRDSFYCSNFSWIRGEAPQPSADLQCKVRHGPTVYQVQNANGGGRQAGVCPLGGPRPGPGTRSVCRILLGFSLLGLWCHCGPPSSQTS
eukprot:jgi/Botrbrau1/6148/Bobra.331_2s0038.1